MDAWNRKGGNPDTYDLLKCEECDQFYDIPRDIDDEKKYVLRKLRSKELRGAMIINVDGESIPVASDQVRSEDQRCFVKAILTKSKVGNRLVVYAGEKGKKNKTQIFVEPEIKRISFDHNDIHPTEIFTKVEATFKDGISHSIKKRGKK